jgi:hypothetical protein
VIVEKESISNVNLLLPLHLIDAETAEREEREVAIAATLGEKFCFGKKKPRLTGFFSFCFK